MTFSESTPETTIAAIDLGSNSFHMVVAQIVNGELQIIDRIKEMVRLGAGLTEENQITPEARDLALACLSRFGQRVSHLGYGDVRAVGTNTLRQVNDNGQFLQQAEAALGHPIEIISGREEARLIYLGVAHGLATSAQPRLVVDIGGGSTELIIGRRMQSQQRESCAMGCVSFSQRFFANGEITAEAMREAIIAARVEIRPYRTQFEKSQWHEAVGSSGTIKAIQSVVAAHEWSVEGISRKALKILRQALISAGSIDKLQLEGLTEERRPVFVGGVAVLSALFKSLNIKQMQVSDLALREGVLYELQGVRQDIDIRDRTVAAFSKRFHLDSRQIKHIETTCRLIMGQVAEKWQLAQPLQTKMVLWAAQLHEIGLALSHTAFHKHSGYILEHADMPGFSKQQQQMLATLVRNHRRKLTLYHFQALPETQQPCALRLCIILRIAVLLHRGRSHAFKEPLTIEVDDNQLQLHFPSGWLGEHPLTATELRAEARYLASADYLLRFD
ncbi:exopolyphosphatase [Ectothiorhodospiraceae bacterium BW-2]|nr:exopolyphosphatase [Ectothiorhodospiraceae bacterium BW-2]